MNLFVDNNLDEGRAARQELGITKWVNNKGIGTLHWTMAVGKSRAALLIMERMLRKRGIIRVIITATMTPVLNGWKEKIKPLKKEFGDNFIIKVASVQEIVMQGQARRCDILIVDEIDRVTGDEFIKAIDGTIIQYSFILGLTGTYHDKNNRYKKLEKFCPVVDVITEKEAKDNGWISQSKEYTYPVALMEHERIEYESLTNKINAMLPVFHNNHRTARECVNGKHTKHGYVTPFQVAYEVATKHGWHSHYPNIIADPTKYNVGLGDFKKVSDIHQLYSPQSIIDTAYKMQACKAANIKLYATAGNKLKAIYDILDTIDGFTIIFTSRTFAADNIHAALNKRYGEEFAQVYHSNLKGVFRVDPDTTDYYRFKGGARAGQKKPLGKKTLFDHTVKMIKRGLSRVVVVTNSFDAGVNLPKLKLAIVHSGDSTQKSHAQRTARTKRLTPDAVEAATIVNLVCLNTTEEFWVKKRQVNSSMEVKNAQEIKAYNNGDKHFEDEEIIHF